MTEKTIPSEAVEDILRSLKDPKLASLKAKIDKRLELKSQTSPADTTNWDDRVLVASTSSSGRSFITFYTGGLPVLPTKTNNST